MPHTNPAHLSPAHLTLPQTYPTPPALPTIIRSRDRTEAALRHALRGRTIARVGRGAYVEVPPGPAWQQREFLALAAIVATMDRLGPDAVLSHTSAARVHGLWVPPWDGLTHVIVPKAGKQTTGIRRHVGPLPSGDIVQVDGIRVASLRRTIVDCALMLPPRWGLAIVDSGLRSVLRPDRANPLAHLERQQHIKAVLLRLLAERPGAPGTLAARAVIMAGNALSESPGESGLRWAGLAGGAPEPTSQLAVTTAESTFYLDLAWVIPLSAWAPNESNRPRLISDFVILGEEYDGEGKYAEWSPDDGSPRLSPLLREKRREDALRERDVYLVRRTAASLRDPLALIASMVARFPRSMTASFRPNLALLAPAPPARSRHPIAPTSYLSDHVTRSRG